MHAEKQSMWIRCTTIQESATIISKWRAALKFNQADPDQRMGKRDREKGSWHYWHNQDICGLEQVALLPADTT